jgi:hypothetical protein
VIGDISDDGADVEEKLQQINQTLVDARTFIDAISSNTDSLDIHGFRGLIEDGNRVAVDGVHILGVLTAIGFFLLRKNAGAPKRADTRLSFWICGGGNLPGDRGRRVGLLRRAE